MKFDSTTVTVEGKEIVIVAVDTNFFSMQPQEQMGLVRGFFEYFQKQVICMGVNQQGDMQYFGRPDLTNLVSGLKFSEFQWTTNEIAE